MIQRPNGRKKRPSPGSNPGIPASQSGLSNLTCVRVGKARKCGPFLRVDESLVSSNLNQNTNFLRKVSGQYLENSRFVEIGSGDWFDL